MDLIIPLIIVSFWFLIGNLEKYKKLKQNMLQLENGNVFCIF